MTLPTQLGFFEETEVVSKFDTTSEETKDLSRANLGTFQDSLRAPVHRWFTYPAGFSFKAVEEAFRLHHIGADMAVYDPFAGTATTNIVASQQGVRSFGVEAHPFVHFVGRTKLYWEFSFSDLLREIDSLIGKIHNTIKLQRTTLTVQSVFPKLVCDCYSNEKLIQLYWCRQEVNLLPLTPFRNFAKLGLTSLLRSIADVATGWPYIAPGKAKKSMSANLNIDVANKFRDQLYQMYGDLKEIRSTSHPIGTATFIQGDSRQHQIAIEDASLDLAFTSPPYLNNYDYSDRTRLEMYFWGEAVSWGDITQKVRSRLIMSATTQIMRSNYDAGQLLSTDFLTTVPSIAEELHPKLADLSHLRLTKGGKKSYDIMVAGYFNDMLKVFRETFRVLKPGSPFVLILGDSAPYGVHIPTDVYLGELGKAIGFASYQIEDLRVRGKKWKDNPQRHKVALKESILTLEKN